MSDFKFKELSFSSVYLIENFISYDHRGGFTKKFEKSIFAEKGIKFDVSEVFISTSAQNVIRGLHFQKRNPQTKIVSVIAGKIWDVIVDLREGSATYMQWKGIELCGEEPLSLLIPPGFAHGFLSCEDNSIMQYICCGAYDKESDSGIIYNDPDLNIEWPVCTGETIHSQRDLSLPSYRQYLRDPMVL